MAEAIERKHRREESRWMPGERLRRLENCLRVCGGVAGQMGLCLLMCCADMLGIPSGLQAAWLAALAMRGESLLWPACGWGLALGLRLLWGVAVHPEQLVSLGIMLLAPRVLFGHGNRRMMGLVALSLLPGVAVSAFMGSTADVLRACASVLIGMLSAPVFLRGLKAIREGRCLSTLEERIAIGYLLGMLLQGGGRLMLFGLNIGVLLACGITACAAMTLGAAAGCLVGVMGGVMLSLQGLPIALGVCLGLGGFLTGMVQAGERRWLSSLCFLAGCGLSMLLSGAAVMGYFPASAVVSVGLTAMPRDAMEAVHGFFRRFLQARGSGGDAYAASVLERWERTVRTMAQALPSPVPLETPHGETYWRDKLCMGCPAKEGCTALLSGTGQMQAEQVWQGRHVSDEAWLAVLEGLRGFGCGRLYQLRDNMSALRLEDIRHERLMRRACHERDMLAIHLTALAGAARQFATLSAGATWWDDTMTRILIRELGETAFPATLIYARRVGGHAEIAFAVHRVAAGTSADEALCELASKTLELSLQVFSSEEGNVTLTEVPIYTIETGAASVGLLAGEDENGDSLCSAALPDGRFLLALSDGMGHGATAHRESKQTVQLIRLCLEAGYSVAQTLTAVNGMMLSAAQGESYATVDLLTVDLWTGKGTLSKLGAAESWLARDGELSCLAGDTLPLGILETVETRTCPLRLRDGDTLLLMTDGVSDAFPGEEALRLAMLSALHGETAQMAAEKLMQQAEACDEGMPKDDRTAVVLRVKKSAASHG